MRSQMDSKSSDLNSLERKILEWAMKRNEALYHSESRRIIGARVERKPGWELAVAKANGKLQQLCDRKRKKDAQNARRRATPPK